MCPPITCPLFYTLIPLLPIAFAELAHSVLHPRIPRLLGKSCENEVLHSHPEATYEIPEKHLIGLVAIGKVIMETLQEIFTATRLSSAEDLSVETDVVTDYKQHKFVDLNRPMFMQVWNGVSQKTFTSSRHTSHGTTRAANARLYLEISWTL